jgi:mevalonate kinase
MGVSTQELDLLVYAALDAGAAGAKLSGGGGGGTIIAISESERIEAVVAACKNAGTQQVIVTQIPGTRGGRL